MRKAKLMLLAFCAVYFLTWADNTNMVLVEGGTFQMGSDHYSARDQERPVHEVTVGSFYMSKYEVTFDEFDNYCELTGRSKAMDFGRSRGSHPVHHVNWYDAINYCNWLSEQEGFTPCYKLEGDKIVCNFKANGYRLPTEAEWEYAARGGNKKENYQYAGGDDADAVSWNLYNSGGTTHPVGTKQPNSLGLYDMTGNLSEWCWDYYGREFYSVSPANDPTGPESSNYRVLRGGDYGSSPYLCRVTMRTGGGGFNLDGNSGFRVVRSIR